MRFYVFGALVLLVAVACADAGRFDFFKKFVKHKTEVSGVLKKLQHVLNGFFGFLSKKNNKQRSDGKPAFCGDYDCPPFKATNKSAMYEIRCYSAQNWVSTEDYGYPTPMGSTSRSMFMKLFAYIKGANKQRARVAMTVPVLMSMKGQGEKKQMQMSFYVPTKFQKNVPTPTDPSVKVESKKFCAYVHSFKGFTLSYKTIKHHVSMLKAKLEADGLKGTYDEDVVYSAGYNKPTKFFGRHNEVMLMKL